MLILPDDDYVLGTGDQLLIRVWGSSLDVEYPVVVDREGVISVPKIGPIPVAGVTYGSVTSVVRREAQKYVQGINIEVTLTRLRSLEIYVVGEVRSPGLHMVPAFSTIFDGLLRAIGVKKTGTLRDIILFRNDKKIQSFDLYDLLLQGNRKSDLILQDKDVLFVRQIGQTAAVAGAVNNPAIFELTGPISMKQLVELSGGMLPQAYGDRVLLKRFDQNNQFVIQDINLVDNPDAWEQFKIGNGYMLEFNFMGSFRPYVVKLTGHVWKPDVFKYEPGMTLSSVLDSDGVLMPDSVTEFALLFRYDPQSTRTIPIRFPLSQVFYGEYDAPLEPHDEIVILSMRSIGIQKNITVTGAVWNPGRFAFKKGMWLTDALALAGGMIDGAREDRITVARKEKKKDKFETRYIMVAFPEDKAFELASEDTIHIPKLKDYMVELLGHVSAPRKLIYHEGIKLSDLLISSDYARAEDILKPGVIMDFGLISRYDSTTTRTSIFKFPLSQVFTGEYDTSLKPSDKVIVLARQDFDMEEKIHINGAVWKTGEFDFYPDMTLNDAIALGGGLKFGARKDHIEVTRQIIEDSQVKTRFLLLDSNRDADFVLQPSDSVLIPLMKNASRVKQVAITGEVFFPGTYTLRESETLSSLIERAGGFTENAYLYGAKYTSEMARMIQQKSIDDMIQKLERRPQRNLG